MTGATPIGTRGFLLGGAAGLMLVAGCATIPLEQARQNYYGGRLDAAAAALSAAPTGTTDTVLFYMERGMIEQGRRNYAASVEDWIKANEIAERLDYYSVSRGSASFLANDAVMSYRGAPYERILVHSFAALSYLALSMWDDAGVEARNIAKHVENLEGYPDDPFSRYLAGACFEMMGEADSAVFQYRKLSQMVKVPTIDEMSGRFNVPPQAPAKPPKAELVCFVLMGRIPGGPGPATTARLGQEPYAEIFVDSERVGRTYTLADTANLLSETERKLAAVKAAKTVTRVIIKDAIADAVHEHNELLGELIRLALFASELPDTRRWETLPRFLQVARVPVPPRLSEFRVVFKDSAGNTVSERMVRQPITTRTGKVYVSFVRDLPF